MGALSDMFMAQYELQRSSYGTDPLALEDEERIQFIKDNVMALQDELSELLGEVGWKPWATSRHVNEDAAMSELSDAWHFFMNLAMTVSGASNIEEVIDKFIVAYERKHDKNVRRMARGYDGVTGKCRVCKRDLEDTGVTCTADSCGG